MNTSTVIHAGKLNAALAPIITIKSRASCAWHKLTHMLFAEPVAGNPLHEAWSADGEPLERVSPGEIAKSCASRNLVVPHSRGR